MSSLSRVVSLRPHAARVMVTAIVLASLSLQCEDEDGFREEEVDCERGRYHVAECCPDLSVEGSCKMTMEREGCHEAVPHDPFLVREQARCLEARTCAELVAGRVCEAWNQGLLSGPGIHDASRRGVGVWTVCQ